VPDTDKTFGQDVKQKAAHELVRGNGHDSGLVAACIVPPTKRDVAAIEGNETVVGDGDTVSVAPEVTDHLLRAAEGGLGVDDPVLAKQRSEKRREALWAFPGAGSIRRKSVVSSDKRAGVHRQTFPGKPCRAP
jgi:hypothetical protein